MTVLFFAIIACMRVIQSNCSKRASALIEDRFAFFHYGGYYQLVSAALGFISLCFAGFSGWNAMTLVCAVAMAALFSLDLFSSLQAVKGGTLILLTMFSTGGLFVPCIVGIFLFDEPMSVFQWLGLAVFFVSVYLLISGSRHAYRGFSVKTFVMLILNLLANGAVMVVQKIFALKVPNGNVSLFSFLSFGLNAIILFAVFCILSIKDKRKPQLLPKKLYLFGSLLAVAIFTINLLVTELARTVESVILFTISSALSIIITSVVGAVFFREKLTLRNICGIALGIGAVLIINFL